MRYTSEVHVFVCVRYMCEVQVFVCVSMIFNEHVGLKRNLPALNVQIIQIE